MPLASVHQKAIEACAEATASVGISNGFFSSNRVELDGVPAIYPPTLNDGVMTAAFMKIFTTFEKFLEESFVCYMMEEAGLNGVSFTKYVSPPNENHARDMIKGNASFPDFTNRDTVIFLARTFFYEGGSYMYLNSIASAFEDMKKIRNAISHHSLKAKTSFEDMVRNKLGSLPAGMTSAVFLNYFMPDRSGMTFFTNYKNTVVEAINAIANPS